MPELFEAYDDIDDIGSRLQAADPAERRVAVIDLGNSGDPAAIRYLETLLADPDPGVRQQVALALGEFDGPAVAAALAALLIDPEQPVALAASDSMAELKDPASADPILPLVTHADAFVRMSALRALKEVAAARCAQAGAGRAARSRCLGPRPGHRRDRLSQA